MEAETGAWSSVAGAWGKILKEKVGRLWIGWEGEKYDAGVWRLIERERERGNDRFRLGFGSVFSVWMVRFDGRRWINLDQYFCIYTPNTLNYSYSFGKGKRKKDIFLLGIREKTESVWENLEEREFQGSEILAVKRVYRHQCSSILDQVFFFFLKVKQKWRLIIFRMVITTNLASKMTALKKKTRLFF